MKITRKAGYIYLSFHEEDWKNQAGGAQAIIRSIKQDLEPAAKVGDEEGWSYSIEEKHWRLPDTPDTVKLVQEYQSEFLSQNTDQGQLFNGTT